MTKKVITLFKQIDTILREPEIVYDVRFNNICNLIFEFDSSIVGVEITFSNFVFSSSKYSKTNHYVSSQLIASNIAMGVVTIYLDKNIETFDSTSFPVDLFIELIAEKISTYLFISKLESTLREIEKEKYNLEVSHRTKYGIVLDLLKNTDRNLYSIITRKMLNFLLIKGIDESSKIFEKLGSRSDSTTYISEINRPTKKQVLEQIYHLSNDIFSLAAKYMTEDFILAQTQRWINDENSKIVTKTLNDPNASLFDVGEAIRKFIRMTPENVDDRSAQLVGMIVSLIRRFFTEQLEFINIAKNIFDINDFYNLLPSIIFSSESYGTLGGKSSGLLLAGKIIEKEKELHPILKDIKLPKTWYIPTDGETTFIYYNNLEDIIEQKYRSLDEIRKEYPYTMQVFKNSQFPQEMINGLSRALDEIGNNPIVVRSSSILEDRMGTAFAGKYKSLFLANQGTKQENLEAVLDAIAEVYASVFSPDPISYRKEKGLLDFNEGMGIIIQEVVGTKVGKYYFPAFAGVGFSNNEFRWTPRIKREDGLLRIVPGLGTRAVDRVGNDFPILIAPGKPDLRVNLTFKDAIAYSPRFLDVINLETNTFETVNINEVINEVGNQFPLLNELFSIVDHNILKPPVGLGIDTKRDDIIVTADNLIRRTKYIKQIAELLEVLKDNFNLPVDIEFACDGKNLYLLQCRQQAFFEDEVMPSEIPNNVPKEDIVFTANKHIANARVPDIAYLVYVDPVQYSNADKLSDLEDVARLIGILNETLPKRSFALLGPGRWGTRDDIRLGVKISYSDINNTALLIEIAKSHDGYVPELSFGTHFFQDLVESNIFYLPLYPDDADVIFNNDFFENAENTLDRFTKDFQHISNIVKVINIRESKAGKIMRVLMNSTEEKAIAYFTGIDPQSSSKAIKTNSVNTSEAQNWRTRMAEAFAQSIDMKKYNIIGIYLAGSVFKGESTPESDINLIIHSNAKQSEKDDFLKWAEGWNSALKSINYNRTGFQLDNILDIAIVSDEDIEANQFYRDLLNPTLRLSKKLK
jgi:predicted nucleotidyltransferase